MQSSFIQNCDVLVVARTLQISLPNKVFTSTLFRTIEINVLTGQIVTLSVLQVSSITMSPNITKDIVGTVIMFAYLYKVFGTYPIKLYPTHF
jgi:hypothetical protein